MSRNKLQHLLIIIVIVGVSESMLSLKGLKLNIFKIIDRRISFYSQNTNMLPRKPKISYRYLKSGIEEFHRKFVSVPADKAAKNVVVVRQLHYINTLKQELSGTKAYEQTSEKEKSVINNHIFHKATRFAVSVNEDQEKLPTFNWLPKLHKNHIRLDLLLILAHVRLPNYQNC